MKSRNKYLSLLLISILVSSFLSVFPFKVEAVELFSDGFEDGTLSAWSGNTTSTGETVSVNDTSPHHGIYHASFTTDASGQNEQALISKNLGSNEKIVYSRGAFKFITTPDANGKYTQFMTLRDSEDFTDRTMGFVYNDGGTLKWRVEGTGATATMNATPAIDNSTYYEVELAAFYNATNGWYKMWVDGGLVINITGLENDETCGVVKYGIISTGWGGAWASKTLVDCVEIGTEYIGPEPENLSWRTMAQNTTIMGTPCDMTVTLMDDVDLDYYVFSFDNGTGVFINDTAVDISGLIYYLSEVKVLNSTENALIRWQVFFNDSTAWGNTDISEFNTTTAGILFDNCDQIGDWLTGPNNAITLDTDDKVEGTGSLNMTWAADGPNWGGMFYKATETLGPGTLWDFSEKPILRLRIKTNKTALPQHMVMSMVYASEESEYDWYFFSYDILSKITEVQTWLVADIDLRLPITYSTFPNLAYAKQLAFEAWGYEVTNPSNFSIDFLEKMPGPPLPLEGYITPSETYAFVDISTTFETTVREGVTPYSYDWFVDDVDQETHTWNFTTAKSVEKLYEIKCNVTDSNATLPSVITLTANLTVLDPPLPTPEAPDPLKSDIRGVFINQVWAQGDRDWEVIANTSYDYGISTVFIDVHSRQVWNYSAEIQDPEHALLELPELNTAIAAFHNKGLNVHILYAMGIDVPEDMASERATSYVPEVQSYYWMCFNKQASKDMMHAIAEALARDYDIDGFMWDYTRYQVQDECFCSECETRFKADTGLNDAIFPTDVATGGKYFWDFVQWRINPVTEMVRDMRLEMLDENPDLLFSAAVLPSFSNCGNWQVMTGAQHTADWVDKGYLDFVAPMIGESDLGDVAQMTNNSIDFFAGGPEGKIPVVIFSYIYTKTPSEHVDCIQVMKDNGADGWIIWRYGGPGLTAFDDMRPFLAALIATDLMEPVWAMDNITIENNYDEATILWTTTANTNSSIEYSDSPLFNGTVRYNDFSRPLYYTDMDYIGGTINSNSNLKTNHEFTIPLYNDTYYRIQNIDVNGTILTSPIMYASASTPPEDPPENTNGWYVPEEEDEPEKDEDRIDKLKEDLKKGLDWLKGLVQDVDIDPHDLSNVSKSNWTISLIVICFVIWFYKKRLGQDS